MAPEGDQEAAAAAATTSFDFAVSRRGLALAHVRAGHLSSGRSAFTSRAQQERSLQRAAKAAHISSSSEASDASDGERWQGNDRRVYDKEVDSDEEQSSRGSPRRSLDEHESAENEPDEAMPAELSAEALAAHRDAMFVSSATGPAATGLPPLAAAENRKVPRLLVKLASAVCETPTLSAGERRRAVCVVRKLRSCGGARLADR